MVMIDESDRLIGLIYEGIADDFHWGAVLERVAAFVGAVGVGLGMQDMESHQFRGLASRGIDLDLSDRYRRLAPTNKIWIEIGRCHQPLTDRMVMPKAALSSKRALRGLVQAARVPWGDGGSGAIQEQGLGRPCHISGQGTRGL
jgi:hypothetical protein